MDWHEAVQELWRTGLLYVLAFGVFRLMGKRSVSHLAPFDVAVVIIIGEAVAIGIEETSKSIVLPIVSIVTLGILQFGLSYVNLKWRTAEKVSQGVAAVLVENGKVRTEDMAREHMSQADLDISLREKSFDKLEEIKIARLEPTGHISVLPTEAAKPAPLGALGLPEGDTLVSYLNRKFAELGKGGS